MASNSALKRNKLTLTFVSETARFQNLYRFVSYFRISSKKTVDTTIQQMIKFDVLSASFIFLLTLFYSFKVRYKKEIYSFLIGQNFPGITNLSQKEFKETSQYVLPFQGEPFLEESQFYFNTDLAKSNLTRVCKNEFLQHLLAKQFDENEAIKLKRISNKGLLFNGPSILQSKMSDNYLANNRTIPNFYHIKHNNYLEKYDKFILSARSANASNTDLLSPYDLAFQSFAAQNFSFSIKKKLEREGTNFKFLELPLNYNSYFGIFQKKDETTKSGRVKQNIFKFPQKKDCILQNKIYDKSQPVVDALSRIKMRNQNWAEIYKQNKVIAEKRFQKSQKNWFYLGQKEGLQTQYVKFRLDPKWKEKTYQHYLQLDEFPLKLGSIMVCGNCASTIPPRILTNQFSAKRRDTLIKNVVETKSEIPNSSEASFAFTPDRGSREAFEKKGKSFAIKRKFLLRGSKFVLNSSKLGFTEDNLLGKFTTSPNSTFFDGSALGDLSPKFKQQQKVAATPDKGFISKREEEILSLQKRANSSGSQEDAVQFANKMQNSVNKNSDKKRNLPKVALVKENKRDIFYLSPELSSLKNEIKALFSSSKNHSYFIEKDKNPFNLLSNDVAKRNFCTATLDDILLNNSLDILLDQKKSSTNQNILQNIGENGEILFYKNSVKQNGKDASFLTQEDVASHESATHESATHESGEHELTQLLQSFWSQKKKISYKERRKRHFVEKTKDNWFFSFISYLSTQPRLMSGYQFPDLNEKEINKLIKYSNSKKSLTNKIQFVKEVPFFVKNIRKKTVYRFQKPRPSSFLQNSKKENCQQHLVDVYLPTNYIQRLPQSQSTSLQKNLFLKENTDFIELNNVLKKFESKAPEMVCDTPDSGVHGNPIEGSGKNTEASQEPHFPLENVRLYAKHRDPLYGKASMLRIETKHRDFLSGVGAKDESEVYQIKWDKNLILQNKISDLNLDKANLYPKPLKFIVKSLTLKNRTEKASSFQIPALLKTPSIWNPKLQKLQIAKTIEAPINKSKDTTPFLDYSKNLFSSTNFLTDRKQRFFAIGNQIEKEQENSFIQRPFFGVLFGLSNNQNQFLGERTQINKNLLGEPLFKAELQNKGEQSTNLALQGGAVHFASKMQNDFRKKDFSILPLFSKVNVNIKDSKGNLQEANKTSKILLKSSKIYKTCPLSIKLITGINFYSFFDISAFNSPEIANPQVKSDETFLDFTENNENFEQSPLTEQIVENGKLNVKRKQLSNTCDKQINSLDLFLPKLGRTYIPRPILTRWLSSKYKKPVIPYRFQKRVFYLPSNKQEDVFLQQKNRYEDHKWGEVEQQEARNKDEEFAKSSKKPLLPITITRSIDFSNTSKVLPSKDVKFSFFTTKPLLSQNNNKNLKLILESTLAPSSILENKKWNVTTPDRGLCEQTANAGSVKDKDFNKLNLSSAQAFAEQNPNFQKKGNTNTLPYKRLSFVPKDIWQEQKRADTLFWQKATKKDPSFLYSSQKDAVLCFLQAKNKASKMPNEIPPLSHFLFDTKEGGQISYLKKLDTNCDRLDWQFYQWHPFSHEKYTYLPPSQSTLNEKFLNSFFKNKLKKRNTIYRYNKHLPLLKFHYVKSKRFKDFNENPNTFRRTYSFSHLQNKQSFSNLLLPKKRRPSICWEPITLRSWMVITQYCYAFFLIHSSLYVFETHLRKVLLAFAPILSGQGVRSGMPSFGETLDDFLGGSTLDKNVLLFRKVQKRFQDIVAIDKKLPQLSEIVWFLRNFGRTANAGTANMSKIQGVLFVGPPGTGKTLLVQAIAGEAEVPVLILSGSSFADSQKEKKGGQLLKRVFQRARVLAPSILFIDEIDTLGASRLQFAQDERDQKNESSRIMESISYTEREIQDKTSLSQSKENKSVKQVSLLTQFLVEMDGLARQQKNSHFLNNKIGKPGGILVIGSTNRPKVLDPALTRPGRFDQVFYLSNPGKQKRIEILKVYTKDVGVSSFLPWDYLGDRTLGFSAADLSALVNKSTIRAVLSHTIHTIQSLEEGIESLPKFSQNQTKMNFGFREENISTYFLSLESKKDNNKNTILCKSIFTSLLICTKHLFLQNKYKNFNFSEVTLEQFKNPLQRSVNPLSGVGGEAIIAVGHDFNLQKSQSHIEFDHSLGIGISFLSRLSFYQAGKVLIQVLLSKNPLAAKPQLSKRPLVPKTQLREAPMISQLSQGPITFLATLWPKQELSFSNLFEESIHVKEVINRHQLETRLISGYAGKAAETLLVSGLQFYKNQSNKTTVTWQSTLGVEEWKLTNSLASLMISKYHFYSQKSITQKENLISVSQNSTEILETEKFQVLENIFSKEELRFSQEKEDSQLSKGKSDAFNTIIENRSFLNPIIWVSNLYQQFEISKIFGQIEEHHWYQLYLPPLAKDEQNEDWVPLDQYYFGRENLIELVWNTSKNKSINWNEISQLDYDFTYQGLVLYHFNKALSLLDQNREVLDLFANLLLSFRTIRRHEILRILSYFRYHN